MNHDCIAVIVKSHAGSADAATAIGSRNILRVASIVSSDSHAAKGARCQLRPLRRVQRFFDRTIRSCYQDRGQTKGGKCEQWWRGDIGRC